MRWLIPAKTFFLGEYAAVAGASAMVVTTTPCFSLTLITANGGELSGLHPSSPAGKWWLSQNISEYGLSWHDPYQGCGGLGASSAAFLGAYLATCQVLKQTPNRETLLEAYYSCAWQQQGLRPSGYDLIAQSQQGCVFLNRQNEAMACYNWPFADLAFILVHTGHKLATHQHLQAASLPKNIAELSQIVDDAKLAFDNEDSELIIKAVNAYQKQLAIAGLTTLESMKTIQKLQKSSEVLAVKGCGALGSDVLLLLVLARDLHEKEQDLVRQGWRILGTSNHLYQGPPLLAASQKKLEILP